VKLTTTAAGPFLALFLLYYYCSSLLLAFLTYLCSCQAMSPFIWIVSALIRWVRLKIYQYEVTFAVYMLTPTEKFIFSMAPAAVRGHVLTAQTRSSSPSSP
jgi:hypothetical protein